MKASRVAAVGLVAAAGLWIGSGYFLPHDSQESKAAVLPNEAAPEKLFRVAVAPAQVAPHSRKLVLSGRTEADRKVMVTARTGGVIAELKIRRGDKVAKGDVIAVLSDEARVAQVAQAEAMVTQRRTELQAKRKLIENGTLPRLNLVDLESQLKAAEAGLAAATAERNRGIVRAPWSGIVTDVPVEVGKAAFSMAGQEIAKLVALDPMLAVVEVSERQLGGVKVGDKAAIRLVTGETVTGKIRFVSKSASTTTRTYRVEVEIANPDGVIPDGITAEVAIRLTPVPATRIPRSALTFSAAGQLGVRTVNEGGIVAFVPVAPVEDEQSFMWVSGIADRSLVIVQGQDFVREGQRVSPVQANAAVSAAQ
jgi:membrane fusion protein, multidrug efflux system